MKSYSDIKYILSAYRKLPMPVRLFILTRYLVCPWESVVKEVSGCNRILDIGCGHGLFIHLINRMYPGITCVGIDHDESKVKLAGTSITDNRTMFTLDTQFDSHSAEKFNCVSFIDVLYSVPRENWQDMLGMAKRFLSDNGRLLIKETVNTPHWKYQICTAQEKVAVQWLKYTKGHAPFLPSPSYFLSEINKAGFEMEDHRRLDQGYPWPHHLFIARSKG